MRPLAANVLRDRHVIFGFGQSNMGCYVPIEEWPLVERYPRNSGFASIFMYGYHHVAGGWGDGSMLAASTGIHLIHGMLFLSLAARMRDAGMPASLGVGWIGGANATQCNDGIHDYYANWFRDLYRAQHSPKSCTLVWSQGEAEAFLGTPEEWTTKTADSFATCRAALGMPDLRIIIVQLGTSYTPGPALPLTYLTEMRAAQQALADSDPHTFIVDPDAILTYDGIHSRRVTFDKIARLIVPIIRSQ